ncbi:hypothetical protein JCM11641_003340 [Rhodosporidiobolus odoratus]
MTTVTAATVAVTADLLYFSATTDGQKPYQYTQPAPGSLQPETNIIRTPYKLPIHDLRPLLDTPARNDISLETTGFDVPANDISGTSMKYEDWQDSKKIDEIYLPEVAEMLKKHTGATKVIFFDYTVRKGEREGDETPDTPDNRKPVPFVHVDQTPESGEKRVRRHAGEDAERLLRGRAQLINVWRPLRGPVLDVPLAVADARTLSHTEDLTRSRLVYPTEGEHHQPEGEVLSVGFSDRHRYYYLSEMGPQEALLLKCWENLPNSQIGTITPHTAFYDPRYYGKKDVPLRQSIETRALVFHEPQE